MNLLEIRAKFRDISGRYDLVNDDLSDNGADFFINEGSKYLDRLIETQKSPASFMSIIAAGTWSIQFPHARAVKEVWITTAEGRIQLTKLKLQDMIATYFASLPAEFENGTPEYYSPIISRYIPETISAETLATFASYVGIITSEGNDYNAITLSCPVDQNTLVEIYGLFYNRELTSDEDENFWSTTHPMMLIQAAIRQTYVTSGNAAMLKIMESNILSEATRIDMDTVEQAIAEADQMEG